MQCLIAPIRRRRRQRQWSVTKDSPMNDISHEKAREAKELLIEALEEAGGPGGPAASPGRIEAVINLIVEAAVEEARERIKRDAAKARSS
jgi:hypothetical protein